MKYFKFLVLFITTGMLQGCPSVDHDGVIIANFRLINELDESIFIYEFITKHDMQIDEVNYSTLRQIKVNTNQEKKFYIFEGQMDNNEKFNFFIFKESIVDDYSWEQIQEQQLYKKYAFTFDELKAMNWELVYNGN